MVRTVAIDGPIPLLGGLFCTRMNLEHAGVDMLLPGWSPAVAIEAGDDVQIDDSLAEGLKQTRPIPA